MSYYTDFYQKNPEPMEKLSVYHNLTDLICKLRDRHHFTNKQLGIKKSELDSDKIKLDKAIHLCYKMGYRLKIEAKPLDLTEN